jgi:hypothetical protein
VAGVHDQPAAARDHQRRGVESGDVVGAQPDGEQIRDGRRLRPERAADDGDLGRVVDQDVELALLAADRGEQLRDRLVIAVVDGHRHAQAAGFGDQCGGFVDRAAVGRIVRGPALRPVTYTVAPVRPSATAIPLPAPRLAPVTTATIVMVCLLVLDADRTYASVRSPSNRGGVEWRGTWSTPVRRR